jgi:hypothetical protein
MGYSFYEYEFPSAFPALPCRRTVRFPPEKIQAKKSPLRERAESISKEET